MAFSHSSDSRHLSIQSLPWPTQRSTLVRWLDQQERILGSNPNSSTCRLWELVWTTLYFVPQFAQLQNRISRWVKGVCETHKALQEITIFRHCAKWWPLSPQRVHYPVTPRTLLLIPRCLLCISSYWERLCVYFCYKLWEIQGQGTKLGRRPLH